MQYQILFHEGFLERQLGVKPKVSSYRSPWQNGVAERFVLSVRNELLNRVIVLHEDHLRRLLKEYADYYNKDRCHLSLDRDSPLGRDVQKKISESKKVISIAKLGGIKQLKLNSLQVTRSVSISLSCRIAAFTAQP